ncbi:MAG: hypothetical protein Q8K02_02940 [Flavobacterium sp.]|nr:hypothetical protein [Flavobacterium sp.]
MDKNELVELKNNNTLKFFEILPEYLIKEAGIQIRKFNAAISLGIDKKSIDSMIVVKDKEISSLLKENHNIKKVLIGGSIYVIGNIIFNHINKNKKGGDVNE